jgi:hypothetical protein
MAAFSREFRLAAACARWPPSDERNEAILTAAAGPLDWARFLRVAMRHQVLGLVHDGLKQARPDVPPSIAREIDAHAARLVRENLAMSGEACRLQELFDDADLPVLFIKGTSLSVLAFGDLGLRVSQDIDLLVPYETIPAATALISRAGYRRFDPPLDISDEQLRLLMPLRKDLGFVHQSTGHSIELHWRLFVNPHAMAEACIMAGRATDRDQGTAYNGRKRSFRISLHARCAALVEPTQMACRYQRPAHGRTRGRPRAPHLRR